jgi:hypothetical protein
MMEGDAVPDDGRYWPLTVAEAAQAQREAADRLAEAPDGWLVRQARQFPQRMTSPPRQFEVERWVLVQAYRIARAASP